MTAPVSKTTTPSWDRIEVPAQYALYKTYTWKDPRRVLNFVEALTSNGVSFVCEEKTYKKQHYSNYAKCALHLAQSILVLTALYMPKTQLCKFVRNTTIKLCARYTLVTLLGLKILNRYMSNTNVPIQEIVGHVQKNTYSAHNRIRSLESEKKVLETKIKELEERLRADT